MLGTTEELTPLLKVNVCWLDKMSQQSPKKYNHIQTTQPRISFKCIGPHSITRRSKNIFSFYVFLTKFLCKLVNSAYGPGLFYGKWFSTSWIRMDSVTYTHMRVNTCACMHTHTHTYMNICMHTYMHACACTCAHIHTYWCMETFYSSFHMVIHTKHSIIMHIFEPPTQVPKGIYNNKISNILHDQQTWTITSDNVT
jgi:hypothetical protein